MLTVLERRMEGGIWPFAFFAEHRVFSLTAAYATVCQSVNTVNHQPESRVREIRTHGSEGGGTG